MFTPTPSPSALPPPGPTGPAPLIVLFLLVCTSAFLWWRVRRGLRRLPPPLEEDDVA